jgi:ABC-type transporter Mla subunit MlaD
MAATTHTELDEIFAAGIDAKREALTGLVTELQPAEKALKAALRQYEDATARLNAVIARVNHALHDGVDPCSTALRDIIADERARRDVFGVALNRARHHSKDVQWRAESLRDEIAQLERAARPPRREPVMGEVVKRERPQIDIGDVIVFPSGRAA